MASKWKKFLAILDKHVPEDLDFQAAVDRKKREITERGAEALARRWRQARMKLEEHEEQKKALTLEREAVFQLMTAAYEAQGITKLDFKEGGAVGINPVVYVGYKIDGLLEQLLKDGVPEKEAKEQARLAARARLRQWFIDTGRGDQLTPNPAMAESLFKEMLESGIPLPEFVKLSTDSTAKLYKK